MACSPFPFRPRICRRRRGSSTLRSCSSAATDLPSFPTHPFAVLCEATCSIVPRWQPALRTPGSSRPLSRQACISTRPLERSAADRWSPWTPTTAWWPLRRMERPPLVSIFALTRRLSRAWRRATSSTRHSSLLWRSASCLAFSNRTGFCWRRESTRTSPSRASCPSRTGPWITWSGRGTSSSQRSAPGDCAWAAPVPAACGRATGSSWTTGTTFWRRTTALTSATTTARARWI